MFCPGEKLGPTPPFSARGQNTENPVLGLPLLPYPTETHATHPGFLRMNLSSHDSTICSEVWKVFGLLITAKSH